MNNKNIGPPYFNILIVLMGVFLTSRKKYFTYYKTSTMFWLIGIVLIGTFLLLENGIHLIIMLLIVLVFIELTDNELWKYRPFLWMFETKDFSGTYTGTIEYLYFKEFQESFYKQKIFKEYKRHSELTLIIYQTGSKINISFFYKDTVGNKTKVESTKVVMSKTDDGQHFILTCYHGSLGILEEGGHHETIVLKFLKSGDDCFIEGGFYDNRKLQGRGRFVDLKKVSQHTLHPF